MRRAELGQRLRELDQAGLIRRRRRVEGPQGPRLQGRWRGLPGVLQQRLPGIGEPPALADAVRGALEEFGVGAGASGHICGHTRVHEALEERLARFVGLPRALHFSTGYMANLGVLPSLAGPGDVIFSDRLNHASLIDAARLSRADVEIFPTATSLSSTARCRPAVTAPSWS